MGLIKLIIKLLVLPLIVAVTLIQWVGIFFTQFSTAIFNLLAGLMFLIRTPSLHTVLKFPCRMNFLLKKTSLWQGNFCFGSLSAGA